MNVITGLLGSNASAIPDTVKLVVLGGAVETARRMTGTVWNGFVDSFFLNAHFSSEDYPYDWLLHWLSKQPAWGRSREFEITTRSRNGQWSTNNTCDLQDEEEEEEELVHGRKKRRVAFMPSVDTTHNIFFNGHWLRITRAKKTSDYGLVDELRVSVVARNNNIIKQLVLEAKKQYEKDAEHRVHIFLADTYGSWRWTGAKQKRPLSSIVLEPSIKEMLIADCKDFIRSEDWYAERGIPYRRGYLLHGVPGSGKTSLIHSLAGELGLDIYVVSLSSKGMSDNTLVSLMGNVPSRCILLLEDLDAAFTRGVSRDASSTGAPSSTSTSATKSSSSSSSSDDGSTLSLSGLLNSLDGVAAAEGRLLFATTNHIDRLDPALSRPGRCDVWVNFTNASRWQAEGLYKCFFPAADAKPIIDPLTTHMAVPRRKKHNDIIQLAAAEIDVLAKRFAEGIPDNEFSVASIQGFLLQNKTRPRECVDEVAAWVSKERETKAKLKKEKEEKEAQEKKEAEEKAKKEKEEKEKEEKEKAEKEKEEKKEAEKKAEEEKKVLPEAESSKSSDAVESASTTVTPSTSGSSTPAVESDTESQVGSPDTTKWTPIKKEEAVVTA